MNKTDRKVVIVTGSGKGIGKGIAELFAEKECIVILATKEESEGKLVEKQLISQNFNAHFIRTDVSDENDIQNMVEEIEHKYGKIDLLVNNAGITLFKPLIEATVDDWEQVMNIDLRGVFLCSKHVAKSMIKTKTKGTIINISSNHSFQTLPNTEIYAAAKGGVNAMSKSMAISLGKYGIRVNSICPGFTDTPHYRKWLSTLENSELAEKEILNLHLTSRICSPIDIAYLVYFLAFEKSEMITGTEILIDGGVSSQLYKSDNL